MYEVAEMIGFRKFRVGPFYASIDDAINGMKKFKNYKFFVAEKDPDGYDAADIFADGEIYTIEKVN